MAVEIERKFLVTSEAWHNGALPEPIRQGYICATPAKSVRIRTIADLGFITIKTSRQGSGTNEFEYEIPLSEALELLDLACEQPVIEKTRYTRTDHDHTWSIDVFKGANAGLIIAEVELTHADETIPLPPWVGEEVTADPRYLNANLFKHPYRSWSA